VPDRDLPAAGLARSAGRPSWTRTCPRPGQPQSAGLGRDPTDNLPPVRPAPVSRTRPVPGPTTWPPVRPVSQPGWAGAGPRTFFPSGRSPRPGWAGAGPKPHRGPSAPLGRTRRRRKWV